jgi:hypothetical protein
VLWAAWCGAAGAVDSVYEQRGWMQWLAGGERMLFAAQAPNDMLIMRHVLFPLLLPAAARICLFGCFGCPTSSYVPESSIKKLNEP